MSIEGALAWVRRRRRWESVALLTLLAGFPLLVAAVVLATRHYYPVLDLAMTELRVRDVGGSHTPLIGLPGRIGTFPDQGSHPGPLSFYLLAPVYRVLGSSAWAMLAAAVVVNLAALATTIALAFRRGGWRLALVAVGVLAVAMRGYGITVLTQPWNPYLPLMAWICVLVAAALVVEGDHRMLVVMVVAGTLCAQTHVPYLVLSVGLFAGAAVVTALRRHFRSLLWAVGVGVVLWTPPLVDQAVHSPGNIRMLERHFTNPPEEAIGWGAGLRVLLRHLDVGRAVAGLHSGSFVTSAYDTTRSVLPGLLVLVAWLASVAVAFRRRDSLVLRLHAVLGGVVVLEALSMARIFGKVWFYLTLWAWVVTLLLVAATVLTFVRSIGPIDARLRRGALWCGAVLTALALLSSTVDAVDAQPPEPRLSSSLGAVVGPTVQAIRDGAGSGPEGQYVVTWTDAVFFGSQGYGLVNELERAGLHVGVDDPFRVPVTQHRVMPRSQADGEIHFASGVFIDEWAETPGAVEVARYDLRTPAEHDEFVALHQRVVDGLRGAGLDDLVDTVDRNLFGVSLDPRLPADLQREIARMLVLGEPVAVFVSPLG